MPSIPDLPGNVVPRHSDQERWLKGNVSRMCHLENDRFPGSQPVSFAIKDLDRLESQDYWVCEKSDGVRVLFLVYTDLQTSDQSVYLIDRHNTYRELQGFFFPHHEHLDRPLRSSLVDGELVIDVDPQTKQERLRFLAFDCLVVDDQNVMSRPLDKRYGRLKEWFHRPYAKMIREHPHMAREQPFEIFVKETSLSYYVEKVFDVDIPKLQHGNDGLIYTCVNTPYVQGTDKTILKWKPPHENSIDFKLILRFPPTGTRQPDYEARPFFVLNVWEGGEGASAAYEPYDLLHVTDEEWEKMKASREQLDERIVEVHWDAGLEKWRMMRFRDDKPQGNHRSVVEKIIQSIADGVEKDELLARSPSIRNSWKARQAAGPSQGSSRPAAAPPPTRTGPPMPRRGPPPLAMLLRYGPLGPSPLSKCSGPTVVRGMNR